MALEDGDGREPLYNSAARPHLILGLDRRGFWIVVVIIVLSVMVPHDVRANLGGVAAALCLGAVFKALGTHAPYALDEIQRFVALPRWGTASASVHAPRGFTPYPGKKK